MKRALITGITGQDGSYLTEFLLSRGYAVHGLTRRPDRANTGRLTHLLAANGRPAPALQLHQGDLTSVGRLQALIERVQPAEIYHLAAQSRVGPGDDRPEQAGDAIAMGTLRLLEALRLSGGTARFFHAGSAEMFGHAPPPQCETTPYAPRSSFAAAKSYAAWLTRTYRRRYSLFAVNGILFNHESSRRSPQFVSRKITTAVAAIAAGHQDYLYLGNLNARRDWGYAPDYVEAMWLMLQQPRPEDYVIGSGRSYTVRDFVAEAFHYAGLDWPAHVRFNPALYRPGDAGHLRADPSRARRRLGWQARVTFADLVRIMVNADFERLGLAAPGHGLNHNEPLIMDNG